MKKFKAKRFLIIGLVIIFSAGTVQLFAQDQEDKSKKELARAKERELAMLEVPSNLIARTVSSSRIDLHWECKVTGHIKGFIVYRREEGSDYWHRIVINDTDARTYSDRNLIPHTKYYYRVKVRSYQGVSGIEESVTAMTLRGYRRFIIKRMA